MDVVARSAMPAHLLGGFSGVGWVAQHVADLLDLATEGDDPLSSLDGAILSRAGDPPERLDHDLVAGLAGLAIAALERLPRRSAAAALARVVAALDARAARSDRGCWWLTRPEHLPTRDRRLFPAGYVGLGLAHGVSGVLVALAGAAVHGVQADAAERLLHGGVRFLLSEDPRDVPYPYWVAAHPPSGPARSAWCHGDAGIGSALLTVSRATGEPAWERAAVRILLRAAHRPPADSGVTEPGLCHGSAGLAHMFARAYRATGHPDFRAAATLWFERTLEMLAADEGAVARGEESTVGDGFLMGRAGIGLALLAAISAPEPTWDRVLGLSIRTPGGREDHDAA